MDVFIQQLINGITLGAIYAMVALGYTMVYGIIQLINLAHGALVMVGAMVAFSAIPILAGTGLPPSVTLLIALLCAVPVCVALGLAMERFAYRPLQGAPRLASLITAIGVSIIIQHVALLVWGRSPLAFPQIIESQSYAIGGAVITNIQNFIVLLSAAVMGGLAVMIYRTRLGAAMRATAQNAQVAGLMGIDANSIVAATFAIGAGLAAVAGIMVAHYYGFAHYTMGSVLGLKAFSAAVLGGIGNVPGAMLGGVLLGLVEALGAGYIGDLTNNVFGSNYQDVFAFIVLILVLVFRPQGLLGERVGDRS
jgi:branched-chain amino acid transport system permease protein